MTQISNISCQQQLLEEFYRLNQELGRDTYAILGFKFCISDLEVYKSKPILNYEVDGVCDLANFDSL